jgi:hypothetical protein
MHRGAGAFHHLDRARAAGHHAGAQRRKVEFREIGVVHLGDKHCRHAIYGSAPLRLDGFESGQWIETFARIDHS